MRAKQGLQAGMLVVALFVAAGCGAPTTAEITAGSVERAEQESLASSNLRGSGDGAVEAMARRPVSYLKEVIPPCVPLQSGLDPCSPFHSVPFSTTHTTLLRELSTISDILLGIVRSTDYIISVAHIVVRGTAKPNTTRCAEYPVKLFSYELSDDLSSYARRSELGYRGAYYNYAL